MSAMYFEMCQNTKDGWMESKTAGHTIGQVWSPAKGDLQRWMWGCLLYNSPDGWLIEMLHHKILGKPKN